MNDKLKPNEIMIKTEADFIGYDGGVPFVEFDENWNQKARDRTVVTIPREHITRMYPLAVQLGRIANMFGNGQGQLLLIVVLLVGLAAVGMAWNSGNVAGQAAMGINSTNIQVSAINATLTQDHQSMQLIMQRLGIINSTNATIPTVG